MREKKEQPDISTNLEHMLDVDLLRLISVSETAFYEVYHRYWKRLYFYAYNILEDRQLSEDVVQEIFVDFWVRRKEVRVINLSNYLHQSVKFQVLKIFRKNKVSQKYIDRIQTIAFVNTIEDSINVKELRQSIDLLLERLPQRCKEIFYLSRFENLSNKEISKKLQISDQTVKNQLSKALKYLRTSLDMVPSLLLLLM